MEPLARILWHGKPGCPRSDSGILLISAVSGGIALELYPSGLKKKGTRREKGDHRRLRLGQYHEPVALYRHGIRRCAYWHVLALYNGWTTIEFPLDFEAFETARVSGRGHWLTSTLINIFYIYKKGPPSRVDSTLWVEKRKPCWLMDAPVYIIRWGRLWYFKVYWYSTNLYVYMLEPNR